MHDNLYGETIPGSTGNPAAYQSGWGLFCTWNQGGLNLSGFRIRYRTVGVQFFYGIPNWHTIQNSIFEYGTTAVQLQESYGSLNNLTLCNVPNSYSGAGVYNVSLGNIVNNCPPVGGTGGGPVIDDHGNTMMSATTLGVNASTPGSVETAGDEDYFRVEITNPGTFTSYTTGTTDTYGFLLDSNGNVLTYNDDSPYPNFRMSYSLSSGVYYVRLRHYSSAGTGLYTLYTEFTTVAGGGGGGSTGSDEHGNAMGSATPLGQNSSASGSIQYGGDEDFFQIQVTTTGTLTAYTTGTTDVYGYLMDSYGTPLAVNDDNPFPNFRLSFSVGPGTYYVRVRHYNASSGTGAYSLFTELQCTDCDNDGLPDSWEQQYFGAIAHGAGEDGDGDGLTNLQEYIVGTNPNQAFSNGTSKNDGQWDKDGDSISNAGEFNWSHTDPNNAYSLSTTHRDGIRKSAFFPAEVSQPLWLQITSGDPIPITIHGSQAGDTYLILSSQAVTGPWGVETQAAGETGSTSVSIPSAGRPMLFFLGGDTRDQDMDGLPDVYEAIVTRTVYDAPGASSDANSDPDGDGVTNLAEFNLGSNPLVSDNPLNFTNVNPGATIVGETFLHSGIKPPFPNDFDLLGLHVLLNGEPSRSMKLFVDDDGIVKLHWVTPYVTNGSHSLQIVSELPQGALLGSPLQVVVSNAIWFPDLDPDCGEAMRIAVKSLHAKGTWEMTISGSEDLTVHAPVLVASLSGTINSEGWLEWIGDTDPEPGWSLGLFDNSGTPLPYKQYLIEVASTPSIAPQGLPSPATERMVKSVEPRWTNFPTKFVVGYQRVYNLGSSAEQSLTTTMTAILNVCYARNQPGIINAQSPEPTLDSTGFITEASAPLYQLNTPQDWARLTSSLRVREARNFFYCGHGDGGHDVIGSETVDTTMSVADLNKRILFNDNDWHAFGGPNLHPYRFVFLFGCNTAKGHFPEAFGIPKEKNLPAARFDKQGLRYRAFMGFNGLQRSSFAGSSPVVEYFNFLQKFFEAWADPQGNRSLAEAVDFAIERSAVNGGPWLNPPSIVIYGYPGLKWRDTIP